MYTFYIFVLFRVGVVTLTLVLVSIGITWRTWEALLCTTCSQGFWLLTVFMDSSLLASCPFTDSGF